MEISKSILQFPLEASGIAITYRQGSLEEAIVEAVNDGGIPIKDDKQQVGTITAYDPATGVVSADIADEVYEALQSGQKAIRTQVLLWDGVVSPGQKYRPTYDDLERYKTYQLPNVAIAQLVVSEPPKGGVQDIIEHADFARDLRPRKRVLKALIASRFTTLN